MLYQWHPGRGSGCLDDLLGDFRGILQCDGYAAYGTHAAKHPGIMLAACWAHVRRKFYEALQTGQTLAAGPLKAIGELYAVEKQLRQSRAGPEERTTARQRQSAPLLAALRIDLMRLRGHATVLPKSPLGRAIDYTLALWPKLEVFVRHGGVEIDNNGIENAIRPTAVGKKNWLFVGGEDTGDRSAIIYTVIESAKRYGHEPYGYIKDLLERLPSTTTGELGALLPENWQPSGREAASLEIAC